MSWLRNIKNKKYPFWRIDTWFSNLKYCNLEIVGDGGWHFTNLKTVEKLFGKMKNFGHHNKFDESNITFEYIKDKIKKQEVFYNHFLDQKHPNKWKNNYKLKTIDLSKLPRYITDNKDQLKNWLA